MTRAFFGECLELYGRHHLAGVSSGAIKLFLYMKVVNSRLGDVQSREDVSH